MKLESMLNEKFPSCGLKAYPHVYSKTKWFRDKYNVTNEILRTSGFSPNDITKMIKYERQSYEDFCEVCPTFSSTSVRYYFHLFFIVYNLCNFFVEI